MTAPCPVSVVWLDDSPPTPCVLPRGHDAPHRYEERRPEFDLVAYLQTRRRAALRALRACIDNDNDADYWRWQGHAELSRQLLERLGAEVPQ